MMRRVLLSVLLAAFCASAAWPKWKEEEQKYLDDHFQAAREQVQALRAQIDALNARVAELQQGQAQLQQAMVRELRALQDANQFLSAMRAGNDESFSNLRSAISQFRAEAQKSFSTLSGQPIPTTGMAEVTSVQRAAAPAAPTPQGVQGYVTIVDGNNVTVDVGSSRGIRVGSRLVVYKATDPNTRVGVLEVTQVIDRENSKAQIVTMNPGIRPEFSDIVRVE